MNPGPPSVLAGFGFDFDSFRDGATPATPFVEAMVRLSGVEHESGSAAPRAPTHHEQDQEFERDSAYLASVVDEVIGRPHGERGHLRRRPARP